MKNGLPTASGAPRVSERVIRFSGKTRKGKISPNTFASNLAYPGKPISREMIVANIGDAVSMIWQHLNLYSVTTSINMLTRVAFSPTAHTDRRRGKIEHCSSPLNEGTFSVQTGGATSHNALDHLPLKPHNLHRDDRPHMLYLCKSSQTRIDTPSPGCRSSHSSVGFTGRANSSAPARDKCQALPRRPGARRPYGSPSCAGRPSC